MDADLFLWLYQGVSVALALIIWRVSIRRGRDE